MYHTVKSGSVTIIIISVQNRGCVGPQYHVNHELMLSVRRKDKNSIRWVEGRTLNATFWSPVLAMAPVLVAV